MNGRAAAALLACALAAAAGAATGEPPLYQPPEPGSYELPVIDRVTEHWLLDSAGERAPLLGLAPGQAALVSFVYRACSDADGCPLAIAVMHAVDTALAGLPDLAPRVRLVTASFDPDHDRPERMRELRESLQPGADWRFLTAADAGALAPVLADFNQDALRLRDPGGEPSARMRHVLKVFLVDHTGAVRNIYSTGLFDPQLVLNDLRTVIREMPTASR